MSMSDPIADMLTRIRNAQGSNKEFVEMPFSKVKAAIAKLLQDEGYIKNFAVSESNNIKKVISIELKYYESRPVIESIKRVSRPGLRVFRGKDDLPSILGGLGVAIISTSRGIMSDRQAKNQGYGGEVICAIY